ncbi:hypothetical protein K1719_046071 [Acacia pycnantha]|nr:hypothetical protein K1719_046071 [Acacia pycnantha]
MEVYYYRRSHVPAFGSWDWNDNLPFTQCFESATQAAFFASPSPITRPIRTTDLYVADDLYQNELVTPAMIVVPHKRKFVLDTIVFLQVKEKKRQKKVSLSKGSSNGFEILSGGKGEYSTMASTTTNAATAAKATLLTNLASSVSH